MTSEDLKMIYKHHLWKGDVVVVQSLHFAKAS